MDKELAGKRSSRSTDFPGYGRPKKTLYALLVPSEKAVEGRISLSCHSGTQGDRSIGAGSSLMSYVVYESLLVVVC